MGLTLSGLPTSSGAVDSLVLASAATGLSAYWQVKVFAVIWGTLCLLILFHLLTHPALLRRRARPTLAEPELSQRIIATVLVLCVLALFALSVLDLLRGWSRVPVSIVVIGDLVVAVGLLSVWLTLRANPYAGSTVCVEPEQTVVSTGPYALVRHPMYSGGLLMFFGAPLALGSWWGLVFFPPILVLTIWRLLDEERYLSAHLPGYGGYCAKVTHRLIPNLW